MEKLKIAILERYNFEGNIADIYMGTETNPHGYNVKRYLMKRLSNHYSQAKLDERLQILYLPNTMNALRRCINEDVRLVNLSNEFIRRLDQTLDIKIDEKLNETAILFAGAGNDGADPFDHEEAEVASLPMWLGVGAVDSNYHVRWFSSWGKGEVFCCGVDGTIENLQGTSFACPDVVGITTLYMLKHYDALGYYPKKEQVLDWISKNIKDIETYGFDLKTGYGVLEEPKVWKFMDTIYNTKDKTKTMRIYENGKYFFSKTDKLIHSHICDAKSITATYKKGDVKAYFSHVV